MAEPSNPAVLYLPSDWVANLLALNPAGRTTPRRFFLLQFLRVSNLFPRAPPIKMATGRQISLSPQN